MTKFTRSGSAVALGALLCVLVSASSASAQATVTGVVRDASGGVLPGVTVEVASPALIEKVRSATTDGNGVYAIVDLRPGTYSVVFTLPGFATVRRDGIELTGNFTATVGVDLRVGSVEETITVTGQSPVVDVQSSRSQQTIDSEHDCRNSNRESIPESHRARAGHRHVRRAGRWRHAWGFSNRRGRTR